MTAPVKEGDVLAGKYRIERVLGTGGMGVVVAATHLQLDQKVALKFLLPEALASADLVTRFAREARAAAKIENEHVARVIDVGTLESGSPFMVMEYLEGKDLSWVIHERGALPLEEAAGFILQACEAIACAHAAGIIHRDLKPANLFLAERADREPIIKVLDFGISKVSAGSDDLSLTKTTSLVGSPLYMSPEQMATPRDVDFRCDIWALGVIFYELLSGATPFVSDSVTGIVAAILQAQPRPPSELRPDLPPDVTTIILRCLEKDPNRRFQNVNQLARELARFAPRSGRSSVERIARVLGRSGETSATLIQTMPPPVSASSPRVPTLTSAASPPAATRSVATGSAAWGTTKDEAGTQKAHRRGILVGGAAALALMAAMAAGGLIVLHLNRAPAEAASAAPPTAIAATHAAAPEPATTPLAQALPGSEGASVGAVTLGAVDASAKGPAVAAPHAHAHAASAAASGSVGSVGSAGSAGASGAEPKLEIRLQR